MVDVNGVWTLTVTLDHNQTYEYGFLIDGQWTGDPANPMHAPGSNDWLQTTGSPEVHGDRVTFRYAGNAGAVSLKGSWRLAAGTLQGVHDPAWDGGRELAMHKTGGEWVVTLTLERGHTYEYGFVVDGRWTHDPGNEDQAPNGNDRFSLR
jgi:hypothetical protein